MGRLVLHVVGARPNFMKMAPLVAALERDPGGHEHLLVHTGQHYDAHLNDAIFRDLSLRSPDIHLGAGSGSHAEQTGRIMVAFERLVAERRPGLVVVAGDVNSTLACSVVAAKATVPVAHLEAGLRSHDWAMPEEINRIVTDRLARVLLTPSPDADANLLAEGTDPARIARVGNCMIDSLLRHLERARAGNALERFGVARGGFALGTFHRPSNVDDEAKLLRLVAALRATAAELPVVFPVHPRTRARLDAAAVSVADLERAGLHLSEPLGYLDFLQLQDAARVVITDSGGIQEETTVLGVPCLTARDNTERPITLTEGTNRLIGGDPAVIPAAVRAVLAGEVRRGGVPALWDGHAGERAARALLAFLDTGRLPAATPGGDAHATTS
ncbi:MAG TPA: UDP-N-acetylglucosamine 2-epimerase (non-hydrolyzing) [Polyangiaceae bacterium]|nr:UDP-N-acetylglucosamine 2-epimerase (non-hydrolyzing) [Polyangiaceae bacterium]